MTDTILILDFGSQYTQLIARRLREMQVYCEIVSCLTSDAEIQQKSPKAIILSGGPSSFGDLGAPRIPDAVLALQCPVLGICYGMQALCAQLGGTVGKSDEREFGRAMLQINQSHRLFEGISVGDPHTVWMSHGDKVETLPDGFEVLAESDNAPFAAIAHKQRPIFAVQFHPEVTHTEIGQHILRNFALNITGCAANWTMATYRQRAIASIRERVGESHVICGLSGGVDSSVTALLLHEAIGEQLTCVFVDTGLLRKDEANQVIAMFTDEYDLKLIHVDAGDTFLAALEGVSDPERKRKIIGGTFIDVFERESKAIDNVQFLAQGTLYPDVIESVSFRGPSVTIKSHHNVGGLPERMSLKLVEPLRELFKDEVRSLGRELGLPESFIGRHPFPGPGLAVRILGEITRERIETLQEADAIYIEEIRKAGLYDEIWQAFAVHLPVKTVGVMGDNRTYEAVCALRAVTSVDGMTADIYPFEPAFLSRVAGRIVNEVPGINRVVYDFTGKPPGTIEWE